jgi:hypothetical protein
MNSASRFDEVCCRFSTAGERTSLLIYRTLVKFIFAIKKKFFFTVVAVACISTLLCTLVSFLRRFCDDHMRITEYLKRLMHIEYKSCVSFCDFGTLIAY